MSAGHIDTLLDIWSASLATHGADSPFTSVDQLYNMIDASPLGDVPWESFSLRHNGTKIPGVTWMDQEFDVWFCDPRALIQNLIKNPDFNNEFDYVPYHEYDHDGNHCFHDFMSGDWAWRQAVSLELTDILFE